MKAEGLTGRSGSKRDFELIEKTGSERCGKLRTTRLGWQVSASFRNLPQIC